MQHVGTYYDDRIGFERLSLDASGKEGGPLPTVIRLECGIHLVVNRRRVCFLSVLQLAKEFVMRSDCALRVQIRFLSAW